MNILLLGATGQVGYGLASALTKSGHKLSVMVRDAKKLPFPDTARVIEAPEFTLEAFKSALRGVDQVIYALGLPEQFTFDDSIFDKVNCGLLTTFLEAMKSSGVRKLTYLSTYEVFEVVNGKIDETHAVADETKMTPYSQSKLRAYRQLVDHAATNGIQLTTIHPAAVYGGLDTGDGVTAYMTNLAQWKMWKLPFIGDKGNFPVIHIDSLCDLILRTLDRTGAYIGSDAMTSLKGIAAAMAKQTNCYVPLAVPLPVVKLGVIAMEAGSRIVPLKPLTSSVQVEFITRGWEPDASKAQRELGWKPLSLEEGLARFLKSQAPAQEATKAA